jgi:hypothetical protein
MSASSVHGLEIHATLAGLRVGSYGPVHLVAYHDTPSIATLRASDRLHGALRKRYPGNTAILTWIAAGLKLPEKEVREVASDLFRRVAREIRCSATVVAGEGFWASAARSVLTGIQILSRTPCPARAFGRVGEASAWLVPHLVDPSGIAAGELANAMGVLVRDEVASVAM